MRFSTWSLCFVLGAALCTAFAWPASAATRAYMKIEGARQGQFKGVGVRQGSSQWIPVTAVEFPVQSPRDAASGQATGKRQHKPIKITMESGAASPQLQEALARNERLKEVVIEFVRLDPRGKEQVYQTITLTEAIVSGIQRSHEAAGKSGREREEISFTYEKIQETYSHGKTAMDNNHSPQFN